MPEMPLPELPYVPGTPEFESWAAEDKGPTSLALCWTFTALAILFTVFRLYGRISLFRGLKSDDYWCLISVVSLCHATTQHSACELTSARFALFLLPYSQHFPWRMATANTTSFCP